MTTAIEQLKKYSAGVNVKLSKPANELLRLIDVCISIADEIPPDIDEEKPKQRKKNALAEVKHAFNGGKLNKAGIVRQLMEKEQISQRSAYMLIDKTIEYLGALEYPDLRPQQVWSVRGWQFKHDSLMDRYNKTGKTWYIESAIKCQTHIDKILGVHEKGDQEIDYSKWRRPRLIATNDPQALNTIEIEEAQIEGES